VPLLDVEGCAPVCPISLQHLNDPVLSSDGLVYEEVAIQGWLNENSRSPCTRAKLPHKGLLRMLPIRDMVQSFLTKSESNIKCNVFTSLLRDVEVAEAVSVRGIVIHELLQLRSSLDNKLASTRAEVDRLTQIVARSEAALRHLEFCLTSAQEHLTEIQALARCFMSSRFLLGRKGAHALIALQSIFRSRQSLHFVLHMRLLHHMHAATMKHQLRSFQAWTKISRQSATWR